MWRFPYIKTFNEFSLDGILSKHIFIHFRSKDSESRKASQYCTTSIVGAFSLGFRPQTAMGSAAATASIADLTPSCNTSYYTAQQPTDAECKSLSWVKINLDEAFLFYCIFYRIHHYMTVVHTIIEVLIKLRGTKIRIHSRLRQK